VQEQGAQVGKRGETLVVTKRGEPLGEARLLDVSQLVLCGNISVTAPAIHVLCEAGIPIVHLSAGHWFYGITGGLGLRNAFDRAAQFRRADDAAFCLELARTIVTAKGKNQRTLLRRNGASEAPVLEALRGAIDAISVATNVEGLLGAEGRIAALYFGAFSTMLRPAGTAQDGAALTFDFNRRNRRPPRDPVNAMLSFGSTYPIELVDAGSRAREGASPLKPRRTPPNSRARVAGFTCPRGRVSIEACARRLTRVCDGAVHVPERARLH
jgi:CRISPR-associated endonuclease Cas1